MRNAHHPLCSTDDDILVPVLKRFKLYSQVDATFGQRIHTIQFSNHKAEALIYKDRFFVLTFRYKDETHMVVYDYQDETLYADFPHLVVGDVMLLGVYPTAFFEQMLIHGVTIVESDVLIGSYVAQLEEIYAIGRANGYVPKRNY